MKRVMNRIKGMLEKSENLEYQEAVVPPLMEVRLKEKSVFISDSGSGGAETLVYSGKNFEEAYESLARDVLNGNDIIDRSFEELYLGYLRTACEDLIKKINERG